MRNLETIFAEVVDKNARVADHGRILDPQGKVVKDYASQGMPAFLEFEMPAGAKFFTLDVNGSRINQALSDTFQPPASSGAPAAAAPPVAVPLAQPVMDAEPVMHDSLPIDLTDSEWKSLPLEFGTEEKEKTDLDLDLSLIHISEPTRPY